MTEAFTNILTQVVNSKKDDGTKQMMKNIKTFIGTNKANCITWLSQIEAAAKFSNSSFRELICQGMAPSMLHVLGELSTTSMDREIKDVILTNFSDIPSTVEAAARLQNLQMKMNEPLVTYNSRYEAIHQVAFGLTPGEQYKTAKKLPQHTKEKLLRKITKKDSYIRMPGDTFRQAKEIDRECSFVDAAAVTYVEQNATKIDTQINELDDSFQDCDINAVNTRSTSRSTDGSFNGSFNRSSSRNSSYNSSFNSRPNFRNNNGYLGDNNQNRQNFSRDNRNRGYQPNNRYDQRNNSFQNRYDNNQDRNRFYNRRRLDKYQHYGNLPRAQVVFEYTNQQPLELLETVKHFINFMKTCPVSREQFKTNQLSRRNFHNEVNESEIHTSSLEEIQQLINKDTDLVFDALVAANYIDKIDCMNGNGQQIA